MKTGEYYGKTAYKLYEHDQTSSLLNIGALCLAFDSFFLFLELWISFSNILLILNLFYDSSVAVFMQYEMFPNKWLCTCVFKSRLKQVYEIFIA